MRLAILIPLLLAPLVARGEKTVHREIDAKTAHEYYVYHQKDGFRHFRVLDARPPARRVEVIPRSFSLPVEAAARRAALEKLPRRGMAFLLYCGDGKRSAAVMAEMKALHFVEVYSLKQGLPAWKKAGYPVAKLKAGARQTAFRSTRSAMAAAQVGRR